MANKKIPKADYYTPQYAITGGRSPLQQIGEFTEDVERGRRQARALRSKSEGLITPPVEPGQVLPNDFDAVRPNVYPAASISKRKPKLTTLGNGDVGFFDPRHTIVKPNDASGTARQLFNVIDPATGNIVERKFLDPKGLFNNMVAPENLNRFIQDSDTFNPTNPSGFDPKTFQILQQFRADPNGLAEYVAEHPEFKIFKQETIRR